MIRSDRLQGCATFQSMVPTSKSIAISRNKLVIDVGFLITYIHSQCIIQIKPSSSVLFYENLDPLPHGDRHTSNNFNEIGLTFESGCVVAPSL